MPSLSADDFLAGIDGFEDLSAPVQTDLLAFYLLTHGGVNAVGPATIASLRLALRLPEITRLAAYLSEKAKRRAGVKPRYVKLQSGYALERAYAALLLT